MLMSMWQTGDCPPVQPRIATGLSLLFPEVKRLRPPGLAPPVSPSIWRGAMAVPQAKDVPSSTRLVGHGCWVSPPLRLCS